MALAMRAASLAGSAGFLGLAVLAALTMSYTVTRDLPAPEGDTVIVVNPEPPPPPPETARAPEAPPTIDDMSLFDLPPLVVFDTASDPVETAFVAPPGPVTIERPRWLERPRDLARYYPRRAVTRGMEGEVVLDCLVSTAGRLSCGVLSETPSGWAFAEAALRIAADHRMAPAMRNGEAVEGRYRMRVPFELE